MPNLYKNPWFHIKKPAPNAKIRLFCFPYAGGSAQVYQQWCDNLPTGVEVIGVQYPGRNSRFADPLIGRCDEMVSAIMTNIRLSLDKPFVFFGHSNGALISFELARALKQAGVDRQLHHFISAKRAIHLPYNRRKMHDLPHDEFVSELETLGGTPPEVLANRELMELFLPVLRNDFGIGETFSYQGEHKLACQATLLYGEQDDDVPEVDVLRWQELIEQPVVTRKFSGDHFFINSQQDELLRYLNERLSDMLEQL